MASSSSLSSNGRRWWQSTSFIFVCVFLLITIVVVYVAHARKEYTIEWLRVEVEEENMRHPEDQEITSLIPKDIASRASERPSIPLLLKKLYAARYVFSLHKSGSTVLQEVISRYAKRHQLCFMAEETPCANAYCPLPTDLSVVQPFEGQGLFSHCPAQWSSNLLACRNQAGGKRGGNEVEGCGVQGYVLALRLDSNMEYVKNEVLPVNQPLACRALVHIRHPFDMVVSAFHSYSETHGLGEPGTKEWEQRHALRNQLRTQGIDAYALSESGGQTTFKNIERALLLVRDMEEKNNCTVFLSRYEDFVSRPSAWALQTAFALALDDQQALQQYVLNSAVKPDATSHHAFVYPGSYLRQLKEETIRSMTHLLRTKFPLIIQESGYF